MFGFFLVFYKIVQPITTIYLQTFSSPQKEITSPLVVTSLSFFSRSLVNTNLCSVPIDLPIPNISYGWNHKICDLWSLASFSRNNVFKVIHVTVCDSTSFPFHGWILFHCTDIILLKNVFSNWHAFGMFPLFNH